MEEEEIALYLLLKRKRKLESVNRNQFWINDLWLKRSGYGYYDQLLPSLEQNSRYSYKDFLRVDKSTFDYISNLLFDKLNKVSKFRECLSPQLKVAITLRYLATGESFRSLAFGFIVPNNTISKFVPEVLNSIIESLGPIHLKLPGK